MVKAAWNYPVDIWNVGAMVWDLFEGKHMFQGNDPDGKGYFTRAHLAEVIGMLGPPPLDLLKEGTRSSEFFDEEGAYSRQAKVLKEKFLTYWGVIGKWIAEIPIPEGMSLEKSELRFRARTKKCF